jgi:thiamine-phosphate diphosphorylase
VLDREDEALAAVLVAHACALQIRVKPGSAAQIARVAGMAKPLCRAAGIPLVINDRLDVALAVGADAVHLGQTDLPLAEARTVAAGRLAIGVSTHDVEQVRAACAGGADYLGFGPIFTTRTKANPDPVQGAAGLRLATGAAGQTPVVAIGGISPADAAELFAAGAAALCAISAVNDAPDPAAAARLIARNRAL